MNGGRKTSDCSLETDSDVTSDLLSDFTDTDYDLRSQRYSGLSEASSDFSFGTSPAWKLFHSVELDRNALEATVEADISDLGSSQQTLRECLKNLKLQGSVTPTMQRRIFQATSPRDAKEEFPDGAMDSVSRPVDKAIFFDVEQYNDKSPEEEEAIVGSPRKLSLVQSLISSIEKRSGSSNDSPRANKNAGSSSAGKHRMEESAVTTQKTTEGNHEMPRARPPSFDGLTKEDSAENVEVGTEHRVPSPDGEHAVPRDPVVYDVNQNVSNSKPKESDETSTKPQRIPGENHSRGLRV
ncbi:hypothetical protein OS493_004429 [Desmophyllum pertusum]|uniref:Uncharacterized protein n=1 Tax=Desmophyllum pertusum TaxID=174260 RepID=A0A9X0D4W0_9CNID|nr:hypothetical protein OS493_004429 [Desmophyllum pertusum]